MIIERELCLGPFPQINVLNGPTFTRRMRKRGFLLQNIEFNRILGDLGLIQGRKYKLEETA